MLGGFHQGLCMGQYFDTKACCTASFSTVTEYPNSHNATVGIKANKEQNTSQQQIRPLNAMNMVYAQLLNMHLWVKYVNI